MCVYFKAFLHCCLLLYYCRFLNTAVVFFPSDTLCLCAVCVCVIEGRLEKNSVAAFLLMIKNMLRNHPANQESLLQCHGPPIIGAMLCKVRTHILMQTYTQLSIERASGGLEGHIGVCDFKVEHPVRKHLC